VSAIDPQLHVVVFVDELNTSTILGMVKEVFLDRTLDGEPLPQNIFFVGAINPYVEREQAAIAFTGQTQAQAYELDFTVRPVQPSLGELVLDFESMQPAQEQQFLRAMLEDEEMATGRYMRKYLDEDQTEALGRMILFAQDFVRKCRIPRVHVSIRDICRTVKLYRFFRDRLQKQYARTRKAEELERTSRGGPRSSARVFGRAGGEPRAAGGGRGAAGEAALDPEVLRPCHSADEAHWKSLVMAITVAYLLRLPTSFVATEGATPRDLRREFEDHLYARLVEYERYPKEFINDMIERELLHFIKHSDIPIGVAATRALQENLFAITVCIEAGIPLIITGPPGCSKTLSFNTAAENMKGKHSSKPLYRTFGQVHRFPYQCNEESTAAEISSVAETARERKIRFDKARMFSERPVLFLDEAGLPEERKHALKVLHYVLDQNEVRESNGFRTRSGMAKTDPDVAHGCRSAA
jgi:hypothetical protein